MKLLFSFFFSIKLLFSKAEKCEEKSYLGKVNKENLKDGGREEARSSGPARAGLNTVEAKGSASRFFGVEHTLGESSPPKMSSKKSLFLFG